MTKLDTHQILDRIATNLETQSGLAGVVGERARVAIKHEHVELLVRDLRTGAQEIRDLLALVRKARYYEIGRSKTEGMDIWVCWRGGENWAVTSGPSGGSCYTREKEWEYEPLPSSRDEKYLARARYTLEEAMKVAVDLVGTS